jgi:hypothetical protein
MDLINGNKNKSNSELGQNGLDKIELCGGVSLDRILRAYPEPDLLGSDILEEI